MEKKMKTRKGKDGFDYPYTSPDIVIDENGKSATKKFEEINSQFKDIANEIVYITYKKNELIEDDSVGLNNIIRKAKDENFIILLEKGKTYNVKNIEILEGTFLDGNGATLKLLDNSDKNVHDKLIKINGDNCTIQNLILDGNINNVSGDINLGCDLIINATGNILKNLTFTNLTFQNSHYIGLNISDVDGCIIDNCRFKNIDASVISNGNYCYNTIVTNCIFEGHDFSEPITISGKVENKFIMITENIIKNHVNGIGINIGREPQYDSENKSLTWDVKICDNIIDNCSCGIQINNCERYLVDSNNIHNVLDGIKLMKKTEHGIISNNTIINTGRSPIVFNASNGRVDIKNNTLAETNNKNGDNSYGFIYIEVQSNTKIIFDNNTLSEGKYASTIKLNNNLNTGNEVYMRNNTLINNLAYEYQIYFDSTKLIANNNNLFTYYGNVKTQDKINGGTLFVDNQNLASSTLDIFNQQCYDSVVIEVSNSLKPKINNIPPQYSGKNIRIIFKNPSKLTYGITNSDTIKLKKTYDTVNLIFLSIDLMCVSGVWYEISSTEIS
mgnify:CR=1 FL=1